MGSPRSRREASCLLRLGADHDHPASALFTFPHPPRALLEHHMTHFTSYSMLFRYHFSLNRSLTLTDALLSLFFFFLFDSFVIRAPPVSVALRIFRAHPLRAPFSRTFPLLVLFVDYFSSHLFPPPLLRHLVLLLSIYNSPSTAFGDWTNQNNENFDLALC